MTAPDTHTGLTALQVAELAIAEAATHVLGLDTETTLYYRRRAGGGVEFAAASYDPRTGTWRLGPWIYRVVPVIPAIAECIAA